MPKLPKDNPRAVALKILLRWEKGKPLLDELLSEVLTKSPLSDERDRALVGELVNGVVRNLLYIDYIIGRFSKIPINEIDPEIKNALRLGVYQLLFTRIPKGVAIAETLKILTKGGEQVGFGDSSMQSSVRLQNAQQALLNPKGKTLFNTCV